MCAGCRQARLLPRGVLASLVGPLVEAGIGVLAVSSFDTDYLLVKQADFERAIDSVRGTRFHERASARWHCELPPPRKR
jgi:hypothetical protein